MRKARPSRRPLLLHAEAEASGSAHPRRVRQNQLGSLRASPLEHHLVVFAGLWLFIGYAFAALICFVLIITIPFGVASLRIALYGVWPFGRAVVPQAGKGIGSTIGNVIWFFVAGWWLTLVHIVTGVALCLTIIGIPLWLANFKLITVGLRPFGREIVSIQEPRRTAGGASVTVFVLGN